MFLGCELQDNCTPWVERVPSASNIADLPARDGSDAAARIIGGHAVDHARAVQSLAAELATVLDLPWDRLATHCKSRLPTFKEV